MFSQFVSGNQTEEGIEMLCLFRNLKTNHQKNLVKLLLEMKKQMTVSELMENLTLVEKLQISSVEIDIIFASRCIEAISVVKIVDTEKMRFREVFSTHIFPKILGHVYSEDVPYDDWLRLCLLFLYNRLLLSNSPEPDPLMFSIVEKTFSILNNQCNMDIQGVISGAESFLRTWMITKAQWKSWPTKQSYYVLQILLISISAVWRSVKSKLPNIRILRLPFSSQFIQSSDHSLQDQWIGTCLGEEFSSYNLHLSNSMATTLGEPYLNSYKVPFLECLVFINDIVDICTHVNHFRKILCSSADVIDQLENSTKPHLQSFLQVLANVAPDVFKSWDSSHSVEKRAKLNEIEQLSMHYYMDTSDGASLSEFIKRASFGLPKKSILWSQSVYLTGYLCIDADPAAEVWYTLTLFISFLVSKLESQQGMKTQKDTGLICFTYLMTQLNWPAFSSVESHITSTVLAQTSPSSLTLDNNLADLLFIPKVIENLHNYIKNKPKCTIYSTTFGQNSDSIARILSHEDCFMLFQKCFTANVENFSNDKTINSFST